MRIIKLTKGGQVKVDDTDFEWLSAWKWYKGARGYAVRDEYLGKIDGKYKDKTVLMHREIAQTPASMDTDHINGDKLDNQRSNLRICTRGQNIMNSLRRGKYTGVTLFRGRYMARIQVDKKTKFLGYFPTLEQAAKAYNVAAIELHGEYARLNPL